jgi:hypothetical protein
MRQNLRPNKVVLGILVRFEGIAAAKARGVYNIGVNLRIDPRPVPR